VFLGQDGGIDLVGLGELTRGAGDVADRASDERR